MANKTVDKQMQEYLKLKKTMEQYYRLKVLLETVRRPDFHAADDAPKPLVHPKTKTKRRKQR